MTDGSDIDHLRAAWRKTLGADPDSAAADPMATQRPANETATLSGLGTLAQTLSGGATVGGTLSGGATIGGAGATDAGSSQGGYDLLDEIGRGGMGVVFRARQRALAREVAVKRIRSEAVGGPARDRFVSEALVNGLLDHPNIVPVHELGIGPDGEVFLAMKLVGGRSWKELLHPRDAADRAAAAGFDLDRHLAVLDGVCNAIAFAHAKGIVHRDLKPENVMVGGFGEVLVMDWGIAVDIRDVPGDDRRAQHRSTVTAPSGTPSYMAPELAEGRGTDIGPWTDVYLLGAILHELLTGAPPHRGRTLMEVLVSASRSPAPVFGPAVPAGLADIATRALSRDTALRQPTVADLQADLAAYRKHRDSERIADAARARLAEAVAMADGDAAQRNRRYAGFAEAVAGFRQALVLWTDNRSAVAGERAARLAYAQAALAGGDLGLAEAQLEPLAGDAEADRLRTEAATRRTAAAAQERAGIRNRRLLIGAVAAIIAGLATGAVLIDGQKRRALDAERIAQEQRGQAVEARTVAEQARAAAQASELASRQRLVASLRQRAATAFAAADWEQALGWDVAALRAMPSGADDTALRLRIAQELARLPPPRIMQLAKGQRLEVVTEGAQAWAPSPAEAVRWTRDRLAPLARSADGSRVLCEERSAETDGEPPSCTGFVVEDRAGQRVCRIKAGGASARAWLSPDGSRVLTSWVEGPVTRQVGAGVLVHEVGVHDAADGSLIGTAHGIPEPRGAMADADGIFAIGSANGAFTCLDGATGEAITSLAIEHPRPLRGVALLKAHRTRALLTDGRRLLLIDGRDQEVARLSFPEAVLELMADPEGRSIAVRLSSDAVWTWRVADLLAVAPEPVPVVPGELAVDAALPQHEVGWGARAEGDVRWISRSGAVIAWLAADGRLQIGASSFAVRGDNGGNPMLELGAAHRPLGPAIAVDGTVAAVALDELGIHALVVDGRVARLIDVAAGTERGRMPAASFAGVSGLAVDGTRVAAFTRDGRVVLADLTAGDRAPLLLSHPPRVAAVLWVGDDRLVTAGDGGCRLWDALSGKLVADLPSAVPSERSQAHPDDRLVTQVVQVPDHKTVITAGNDGSLQRWDARSGAPIGQPWIMPGRVGHVALDASGRFLAATMGSQTSHPGDGEFDSLSDVTADGVQVWDVAAGEMLTGILRWPGTCSDLTVPGELRASLRISAEAQERRTIRLEPDATAVDRLIAELPLRARLRLDGDILRPATAAEVRAVAPPK